MKVKIKKTNELDELYSTSGGLGRSKADVTPEEEHEGHVERSKHQGLQNVYNENIGDTKVKLTKKQLINIIKEELKESYGQLGPDDETEQKYHGSIDWQNDQDDANRSRQSEREGVYTMNKEKFVRTQYINWVNEFNSGNPEELEKIVEVLEKAYDELGEAFELDGTGLYE